ncbi:MAG TPA: transketolase C-terminal domain-containing protein, partial [Sphingopyxis terrae]|nr:transketolase C-terminal domain-containing protein [Sphingopyxis terrae]
HDAADIRRAIDAALADGRPSLIACKTLIGFGAPNKQGTSATHGSPLGADEVAAARANMGWTAEPFVIPADIADAWRGFGQRGQSFHAAWKNRLANSDKKTDFEDRLSGKVAPGDAFKAYLDGLVAEPPKVATRKASENALTALTADIASLVGGSADLTGSNNTKTPSTKPLNRNDYSGRYIYYGIREFGMSAAMNGMALHGGVIPYGGTFLVFSDYCRGAIRLSALQRQRVVYVMTHDSIGLGEDGPTHQPIEHLQSLRAMPNLLVMRPADAVETAECWAIALAQDSRPTLLALTRQNLPPLRHDVTENLCLKGGYRLRSAAAARKVVLVATGSEVSLALDVAEKLEAAGQGADVVSMVSTKLFDEQDAAYQADLLPDDALIVSIEAGTTFGWERYTGRHGLRFGIDSFGASAPIDDLYRHFGLTVDAITPKILARLGA